MVLIGLSGRCSFSLILYGYREIFKDLILSESLVSTYESVWFQTLEISFAWFSQMGERGNFCDPETEIFPEEELSSPDDDYRNLPYSRQEYW